VKQNSEKLIAKVTAQHILVTVDAAATDEQVAAAKAKAEGYLTEINAGLDFAEAAKKYSEDTGSATTGGYLDPFSNGDMVKEFSDAAYAV
jgi:parvulin-like peptidyl-prolyl isomerase